VSAPSVDRTFETPDEEAGRVIKHAETLIWRAGNDWATYHQWPTYSQRTVSLGTDSAYVRYPWYGSHYASQVDYLHQLGWRLAHFREERHGFLWLKKRMVFTYIREREMWVYRHGGIWMNQDVFDNFPEPVDEYDDDFY